MIDPSSQRLLMEDDSDVRNSSGAPLVRPPPPDAVQRHETAWKELTNFTDEIWGPGEWHPDTNEEKANIVSSFVYSWIGDFMHRAAREELEAETLPAPTKPYRTYVVGRRQAADFQQRLRASQRWHPYIGHRISLKDNKKNGKECHGVLRWIGTLRRGKHPKQLMAGVEWDCPEDVREARQSSQLEFHSGTVQAEYLFSVSKDFSATCEPVELLTVRDPHTGAVVPPPVRISALRSMFSVGKWYMLEQIPYKVIGDTMALLAPLVLELFVDFLGEDRPSVERGCLILAAVFGTQFLQSVTSQKYYHISIRAGSTLRNAFVAAILEKCFTISSKSLAVPEMSTGRIVNMVSTDVERVNDFQWYAMYAWAAPIQLCVAIGLLYRLVGWCAFAGIVVMFVTMPAQGWIARKQQLMRLALSKTTDQRIKFTNELFSGIRIVKYMGWESKFVENIQGVRQQELRYLAQTQWYRVLTSLLNVASPAVVMASVLVLYHISGHTLTAAIVFPTISLLNLLRYPFMAIPMIATSIIQLFVALERISKFFEMDNAVNAVSVYQEMLQKDLQRDVAECEYAVLFESVTASAYVPVKLPWLGPSEADVSRLQQVAQKIKSRCQCFNCLGSRKSASTKEREPLLQPGGPAPSKSTFFRDADSVKSKATGASTKSGKKSKAPPPEDFFTLQSKALFTHVSLSIPRGKLTVVLGPTGCGKSSLLDSLIGQLEITNGNIVCDLAHEIAYVPQQAWIMNATVRSNIVFFDRVDEARLKDVVRVCQLEADMEQLVNGIETEIGEKGVNLSGGQRARVSLARAVYANRGLYLLDDPLSALDGHVGEEIMKNCICGPLLSSSTRILTTHQSHVVPLADHVVVMGMHGVILFQGPPAEYEVFEREQKRLKYEEQQRKREQAQDSLEDGMDRIQSTGSHLFSERELSEDPSRLESSQVEPTVGSAQPTTAVPKSNDNNKQANAAEEEEEDTAADETADVFLDGDEASAVETTEKSDAKKKKEGDAVAVDPKGTTAASTNRVALMSVEEKASGSVAMATYRYYCNVCGGMPLLIGILVIFTVTEILSVSSTVWLSIWSVQNFGLSQSTYLYVFVACIAVNIVCAPVRFYAAYRAMLLGSMNLHQGVLYSVATAPMSFFDTTPLGRILNRFSRDVDMTDNMLQMSMIFMLQTIFASLSTVAVMISSQPFALVAIVPSSVLYYRLLVFYNATNREVRRISNIVKSPVYALLTETLTGYRTVRAYGKCHDMMQVGLARLDIVYSASYMQNVANRWLGIRIEFLGNIIITTVAVFAVAGKLKGFGSQDVGMLSLGLTMALSITQQLNWIVRSVAAVEADMNCVERILHYTREIDHEPLPELTKNIHQVHRVFRPITSSKGTQCPEASAIEGAASRHGGVANAIVFEGVELSYRPGLPLVLKGVSFSIERGHKVGVVGRTGSGKSTLLLALLRIVPTSAGEVYYDGARGSLMDLAELRSQFAMIPQDPQLFEGTVRSNLDPFGENSPEEILHALSLVGMENRVLEDANGIDSQVLDGGSNFSVGQRQLLCLARALLKRRCRYILMDEATANIDHEMDAQIQKTVKRAFKQHTVLTIAHRLHTILSYDKILVLHHGELAEYGSPYELATKEGGMFRSMIAAQGRKQEQKLLRMVEKYKTQE